MNNSNIQLDLNEIEGQRVVQGFGQGHSRIQTEPSSILATQHTASGNETTNNLYQMTFNSSKYRKEQQISQQSQFQNQTQLINNQLNFTGQNHQASKQQLQATVNMSMQNTNNSGIQSNQQQSNNSQMQQQQLSSQNMCSTHQGQQQLLANNNSNAIINLNSQKSSSRVRSNHSYLSGTQVSAQMDSSVNQSQSRFFQPAYDLFFEIQRKLDKDLAERLKQQIPIEEKKDKIYKYEAANIISFIKIMFEAILTQNSDLKVQIIELQNANKIISASLSTTHHNTTNQSNGNMICEDNSVEITCKYCKEYEQQLQKLEGDIRQHIRIQQQLKISIENNQSKIEESERDNVKMSEKIAQITKEYEEIKTKLEEKTNEIQVNQIQKQNLEKQLEQLYEKNKLLENRLISGRPSTSNLQINMSTLPSNQQSSHQSFIKTKSVVNNKHILDSFVDDGLLHEVDKSSSSKANFSSLSTAQQLQKSQELQKINAQSDSQKSNSNLNNFLQGNKIFGNEAFTFDESGIRRINPQQEGEISQNNIQNLSTNRVSTNHEFVSNENEHLSYENKKDKQSEELINIQKKLKKLQKISEQKLQSQQHSHSISQNYQNNLQQTSQDMSLQKELTERNGSVEKYQKPQQLSSNTQRLNTISNLVGISREIQSNKQVEEKQTLNSSNQNLKMQNNSFNTLKNQSIQQQQLQQALQGNAIQMQANAYGTIRNVQQQVNRPSSTLGQRDINSINNTSFNTSKPQNISSVQIQQNVQQLQKLNSKSNSQISNHASINNDKNLQITNKTKIPKSNSNSQQFGSNININSHNQNSSQYNINQNHQNIQSSSSHYHQKQSSLSKQSASQLKQNDSITNRTNTSGTININNYINPSSNQATGQSPQKIFSGRQNYTGSNNCDTDRERNTTNQRQNGVGQNHQNASYNNTNGHKTLNNQKSYEKLRAFMNSPKFKTDEDVQSNTRSQSMDGQSSYRNINQVQTQRSKHNIPVQNQSKAVQKLQNQSSSIHYQINLSMNNNNNNISQLNSSIHNRSHF
ncbi:hypothetical protein ABPG72_000323 [Tetrahymena utriculariae]